MVCWGKASEVLVGSTVRKRWAQIINHETSMGSVEYGYSKQKDESHLGQDTVGLYKNSSCYSEHNLELIVYF